MPTQSRPAITLLSDRTQKKNPCQHVDALQLMCTTRSNTFFHRLQPIIILFYIFSFRLEKGLQWLPLFPSSPRDTADYSSGPFSGSLDMAMILADKSGSFSKVLSNGHIGLLISLWPSLIKSWSTPPGVRPSIQSFAMS